MTSNKELDRARRAFERAHAKFKSNPRSKRLLRRARLAQRELHSALEVDSFRTGFARLLNARG